MTPDRLNAFLEARLDPRLQNLIHGIQLSQLSRLEPTRLERTAFPRLGLIELVSGDDFAGLYDQLYVSHFHGQERERSDLIVSRLHDEFAGRRKGLAPYRVLGVRDQGGQPVGAAQFSILFLKDGRHVVPYLQYIYIRPENRRQDLSELLHTLVLAVAMADAAERRGQHSLAVPFTLLEMKPAVHGIDAAKRAKATETSSIHSRSGSQAMMLRRKTDGRILSAHVQPGLEVGEPPLTLIWALRANPALELVLRDESMGHAVLAAYYQSLRDEGFPEASICLAEGIVADRCRASVDFLLMPLAEVTEEMYVMMPDGARSPVMTGNGGV